MEGSLMKSPIVTMALASALAASAMAQAQTPSAGSRFFPSRAKGAGQAATNPAAPADTTKGDTSSPAKTDPKVLPSAAVLPEPIAPGDIGKPTIPLPTEPIDPYMLTKEAGPFMVLAHTFRGPDSPRYALALVLELRRDFNLPAWVFLPKVQPMHSNIRGVLPTAPDYINRGEEQMTEPEKVRIYDEAAVLVGNCKTLDDSEALMHKVKKLHPKCIDGMPSLWDFRKGKGLSRALRTTNPLVPAQYLYPRKADPLIKQMNAGPMSVFHCPGRYTLQVAEFTGRASIDAKDKNFGSLISLRSSPLMTAADNAEKMADALAKDEEVVRTGFRPYVYHDRTSSKVMVGAFNAPDDRAAGSLRQTLNKVEVQARISKKADFMLVPAPALTDLQQLPPH
jgi:hypothetical protein